MDIDDEDDKDTVAQEKLATHVLQFVYCSLFHKFDFPCAYILINKLNALKLNDLFWTGVSLLHNFDFKLILACCDGAPVNKAFLIMNGIYEKCSVGYNILWDHIWDVYQHDRRRHVYSTKLRSAHLSLDSLSKMRVKLAVETL